MKIAVSACLLGTPCRYDGASKPCEAAMRLLETPGVEVLPVCPEVAGGLPTPRPASEIVSREPKLTVRNTQGADVTAAFERGALDTLELLQREGCTRAVLKAKSPSCGKGLVYDGTFSGALVPGDGVAAALLAGHGVRVINETELEALPADAFAQEDGPRCTPEARP